MARRTSRRLVALSSSAIAAIYLAGYVTTQSADPGVTALAAPGPAAITAVPSSASTAPPPVVVERRSGSTPRASVTPPSIAASGTSPSPAAATTSYRDGTYQGTGSSRFGNVSVAVTVQGSRITNVSLTRVTTSYPASRIAGLPAQVVVRQSAQVDRVTGATYSARAFQQAVQQALAQAGSGGAVADLTDSRAQAAG